MIRYKAYLDESGCHNDSEVLAVGGYLVPSHRAESMERKWKNVLKKYKLPYYHMVDCAHGNGVFSALSREKRIKIQKIMIKLINNHISLGFVTIVNPKRLERMDLIPDAYLFCIEACFSGMIAWFADKPPSIIDFVFEKGHRNGKKANEYLLRRKNSSEYGSHNFASKQDVCLLQSADILVWHSRKYVCDKASEINKPRADFVKLMQAPTVFGYAVLHDDTLALSIDNWPALEQNERDEYIRAMFSQGASADQVLKSYCEKYGTEGMSTTQKISRQTLWYKSLNFLKDTFPFHSSRKKYPN